MGIEVAAVGRVDFNALLDGPTATDGFFHHQLKGRFVPAPITSSVVRSVLSDDLDLPADEVIRKARIRGVTAPEKSIRDAVYGIRSELKKKAAKSSPPKPVAAPTTRTPEPAPVTIPEVVVAPVSSPSPSPSAPDLSSVLANVARVNTVIGECGGAETARQVVEAIRACGSVDAFLQNLDLVATIRGRTSV